MNGSRRHTIPRLLPALVISVLLATCATASIASATTSSQAGLAGSLVRQLQRLVSGHVHDPLDQGRSGA